MRERSETSSSITAVMKARRFNLQKRSRWRIDFDERKERGRQKRDGRNNKHGNIAQRRRGSNVFLARYFDCHPECVRAAGQFSARKFVSSVSSSVASEISLAGSTRASFADERIY